MATLIWQKLLIFISNIVLEKSFSKCSNWRKVLISHPLVIVTMSLPFLSLLPGLPVSSAFSICCSAPTGLSWLLGFQLWWTRETTEDGVEATSPSLMHWNTPFSAINWTKVNFVLIVKKSFLSLWSHSIVFGFIKSNSFHSSGKIEIKVSFFYLIVIYFSLDRVP